MQFRKVTGDTQPETGASVLAAVCVRTPVVRREHELLFVMRNAISGVRNADDSQVSLAEDIHGNRAARRGELVGVAQQIRDDSLDTGRRRGMS